VRHSAATIAAAAVLAAGCGTPTERPAGPADLRVPLEEIERRSELPAYWLGRSFEGLPLTHADAQRNAFFVYGECRGEGTGDSWRCTGPQVQLQHWPVETVHRYGQWRGCTRTTIRGVPAAQFDGFEIYTGRVMVKIYAPNQAQARRAAELLRPLRQSAAPTEPLPPPAIDVADPLRQCALDSIDDKLHEVEREAQIPLLWLGRRFEMQPLFRVDGNGRWVRFLYGACKTPDVPGSCWPPVTLELSPLADFRPAGWAPGVRCRRLGIRGAEAALVPAAHELVVFTGVIAVRLQGPDLDSLERAARALEPLDAATEQAQLTAPPDDLAAELRRVCTA
jgi:hypothetical protein